MRNAANKNDRAGWAEFFPAGEEAEDVLTPPARTVRWSAAQPE
jgi:hypothetical protein